MLSRGRQASITTGSIVEGFVVIEPLADSSCRAVYLAFDPTLDRTVALHIFAADGGETASAFAGLSHPSLATVHRSGHIDDHEWVATATLHGETLADGLSRRPMRSAEIVGIFVEIGEALAAIHAAGLVHGSIDLDHIAVEADGQVVLDLAPASRVAADQDETSARRSDRRAYFGALWHALSGTKVNALRLGTPVRRVPSWLRSLCEQGVHSETFASTALAAPVRDGRRRSRRRRLWALAGGVAVVGLAATTASRADLASQHADCVAAGDTIDELWNPAVKGELAAAFVASEASFAPSTVDRFGRRLDTYRDQWRNARRDACVAHRIDHGLSNERAERVDWCLLDRKQTLAALITALRNAEDAKAAVAAAMPATNLLEDPDACSDPSRSSGLPAAPPFALRALVADVEAQLTAADAFQSAGQTKAGLAAARSARRAAEGLGWAPLLGRAFAAESSLLVDAGDFQRATAVVVRAYDIAFAAREWKTVTDAAVRRIYLASRTEMRLDLIRAWAGHAQLAASLADDPSGLVGAFVTVVTGGALSKVGRFEEAEALARRGLKQRQDVLGADHPSVLIAQTQLGMILRSRGKFEESESLLRDALQLQRALLGEDHPVVGYTLWHLCGVAEERFDFAAGRAWAEEALAILEPALGPEHPTVGSVVRDLGLMHHGVGDQAQAERFLNRALEITQATAARDSAEEATSLRAIGRLKAHQGHLDEAETQFRRAAKLYAAHAGTQRVQLAGVYGELADLLGRRGDRLGQLEAHEQEIEVNTSVHGAEHHDVGMGIAYRGFAKYKLGDLEAAYRDVVRGLALVERGLGPKHPWVAFVLGILVDIETARGNLYEAEATGWRALAIVEQTSDPDSESLAPLLLSVADTILAKGEPKRALPPLRRAMAILTALEGSQPNEDHGHWRMATTLTATGGDAKEARRHAELARDGWLEVGRTQQAAEASAWLNAHNDPTSGSP